jgi:hypothetical protein
MQLAEREGAAERLAQDLDARSAALQAEAARLGSLQAELEDSALSSPLHAGWQLTAVFPFKAHERTSSH